jgi:hypothetical protein
VCKGVVFIFTIYDLRDWRQASDPGYLMAARQIWAAYVEVLHGAGSGKIAFCIFQRIFEHRATGMVWAKDKQRFL